MNILILQGSPRKSGNTAKADEQKTEATRNKIVALVKKL